MGDMGTEKWDMWRDAVVTVTRSKDVDRVKMLEEVRSLPRGTLPACTII